jgi:hypothetical protein
VGIKRRMLGDQARRKSVAIEELSNWEVIERLRLSYKNLAKKKKKTLLLNYNASQFWIYNVVRNCFD